MHAALNIRQVTIAVVEVTAEYYDSLAEFRYKDGIDHSSGIYWVK